MTDINIYAFGGTGINILNKYLIEGKSSKLIGNVVGIDTSNANPVVDNAYPLERLEGAEGSGGDKKAYIDKYPDFVKQVLAKHQPNKLNVVIFSTGGGTGASAGPFAVRYMLQKKIPVLALVVGDMSTVNEQNNTVGTLGSLYNQTKLGSSVLFSYLENGPSISQGEINRAAVGIIDNFATMFNLENERIDYADIKNFFYYTDVVAAEPVLTQLAFLQESDVPSYKRTPVAAMSLYNNIDEIKTPFEDMLYRKAGIFGSRYQGVGQPMHAVLDHGNTLDSLKEMIANKENRSNELSGRFKNKETNLFGGSDVDDDGMM